MKKQFVCKTSDQTKKCYIQWSTFVIDYYYWISLLLYAITFQSGNAGGSIAGDPGLGRSERQIISHSAISFMFGRIGKGDYNK